MKPVYKLENWSVVYSEQYPYEALYPNAKERLFTTLTENK